MATLRLVPALRQGGSGKKQRHYLDFVVSGHSLRPKFQPYGNDLITLFGWIEDEAYNKHVRNVFTLHERSELKTGRVMLYVCPQCGDIDCGAITAIIEDQNDRIVWKDFGHETGYGGLEFGLLNLEPIEFDKQSYFRAFASL